MTFRRLFSHLCVDRRAAACANHQLLRVSDDDVLGLSNLRLSSSAPNCSSSYLDQCPPSVTFVSPRPAPSHDRLTASRLPFPVRVLANLYLGDAATARDLACLRAHNIQYIVNVTADVENAFEDDSTLNYMRIAITDHWSETPTSFFTSAINFIGLLLIHLSTNTNTIHRVSKKTSKIIFVIP